MLVLHFGDLHDRRHLPPVRLGLMGHGLRLLHQALPVEMEAEASAERPPRHMGGGHDVWNAGANRTSQHSLPPPCRRRNPVASASATGGGWVRGGGGAEGKGCQRRPQKRLDRRLEEVAKAWGAVTFGYKCHRSWHLLSGRQWLGDSGCA